ncbi:hypothetical protein COCSUDRAFT_48053 [Coccomyxa subellipsoidea C-169]|uniref:U-box domain-containing protein n=1 Tax=Coccomyxa subellipsoidea (strain C-169) TaxID=574566 RepID=I0YUL6_COCSC|nr:hypothetical protein COCSUDRAFT_48053 [Coccomyxa subellipsoidea C-169]EIE22085.1 hypothetical protein COCSUDRAFT_48053 [Coccomyxa subellipsoidea C-169]|eukprot:XP_005646629.1 hypothetical protein COCSUDRAFT_48053 [Coccomyxa subellipsoidea C-169]
MVDATKVPLADGQPSNKQWEQIKEKLKTAWHRKESATFDKAAFVSAASEAGISDSSMVAEMILYAGYASQLPVKRSGQSAFSWVPLVAVAAAAQGQASSEKRAEALTLIIQTLVSVGKEAEADEMLDGKGSAPADLVTAAEDIDGIMLSMRKASRLGLAGASFGRPKSLKQSIAALSTAITSLQELPADQRTDTAAVQKAFKRLVTEVEAAKQLRDRAVDALTGTEPKDNLTPAHQAVSKAIFAHQGPALERELTDLRSAVDDAEGALETAKPALKDAGLDADSIAEEADQERKERLASRLERPKGTERRRRSGRRRRGRGHAAEGSSAEDESADDTDGEEAAPADGQQHAGENGRNGPTRQRRGGRTRGGERRRAGGGSGRDFTAPRDAASEDDEEDGVDGGRAGGASPSGRSTAAAPPGFGDGDQVEGQRRRRGGRGPREKAAGANDDAPGLDQGGTEQADGAEGGKRATGRRRGGRNRRPRAGQDGEGAAGGVQTFDNPTFADGDGSEPAAAVEADGRGEAGRRSGRKRPNLKDVARILEAIKRDLCDPITKAPLRDPVAAADGFTYERASIEEHLRADQTSPVTGNALSSTALFPSALATSLLERLADVDPAAA